MAVFSYTKIADYILDQFWGFASANTLKNSLRYIAEDVLGDPAAGGDKPSATAANAFRERTTRASSSNPGLGGVAISTSGSGVFTTTGTTYVDVTNLTCTIVTSGRPIYVGLIPDGAGNSGTVAVVKPTSSGAAQAVNFIKIVRDSTDVAVFIMQQSTPTAVAGHQINTPCGCVRFIDVVGAGTYAYKIQIKVANATDEQAVVSGCKLFAFEL